MRAQLLHLSGPLRGRTITYKQPVVHVGRAPSNEAALTHALVADEHARIEWVQDECKFHLRRVDGKVFVNGNEVEEIILKDGDMLEFGAGGPTARFRTYVPIGAVCKPVRRMLGDAAEVRRHSGAVTATRTLTSDLLTQATLQLKVGFPILVLLVGAGLYYWFGDQLSKAEARITADRISREQLQEALAEYRSEIDRLNKANAVVRDIQKNWSRGVCMIHGIYRLRMFIEGADNQRSEELISRAIRIAAPITQRWWFLALAVAATLAVGAAGFRELSQQRYARQLRSAEGRIPVGSDETGTAGSGAACVAISSCSVCRSTPDAGLHFFHRSGDLRSVPSPEHGTSANTRSKRYAVSCASF